MPTSKSSRGGSSADLGSRTGVRWAGRARPSGWVDGAHPIEIGPYRIRLGEDGRALLSSAADAADPPNPLAPPLPGPAALPIVAILDLLNVRARPSWRLDRMLALVGRSPDCQVQVSDLSVSRFHCSLLHTPQGVWVVDLLGRKGVQINGGNVRSAQLDDGDELCVGKYLFRIRYAPTSGPGHRLDGPPRAGARALVSPTHHPSPPVPPEARVGAGRELEPMTWPSPIPEPGRILVEMPPERAGLVEPLLELVVQQFDRMQQQMGGMQQQMCDQFHQTTLAMLQMLGTIQRDQMGLVREEIEEIRRLTQELKELQAGAAHRPPAPSGPALAAAPGHNTSSDTDDRTRSLDWDRASQAPPHPGPLGDLPPDLAATGSASGLGSSMAAKASPRRDRTLAGDAADPSPAPASQAAGRPAGPADDDIHDMLSRRIAELQRERQNRWHRILNLVVGN